MNIVEAMKTGRRIRRPSCPYQPNVWLEVKDSGGDGNWLWSRELLEVSHLTPEDILAEDWEVE